MFVQLLDALATMRCLDERGRPVPFSLEVTTCDEQRDTGGENLVLTNWVLLQARPAGQANNEKRVRRTTEPKARPSELAEQVRKVKNPLNDEIRTIAIRLITAFNGQEVLW